MAAAAPSEVKVRFHAVEDGQAGPVLVSFPQGAPPEQCLTGKGDGDQLQALRVTYMAPEGGGGRKRKRALQAANDTVTYEARTFGEDAVGGKPAYKYVVGLLNAKHQRLDLYEAEAEGAVFRLQLTTVRGADGVVAGTGSGGKGVAGDLTGVSANLRRSMLIDTFGSRKKQKMERSKAANVVDVDAVTAADDVAAALQASSAQAAGPAQRGGAAADAEDGAAATGGRTAAKVASVLMEARRATLPPFDLTATTPAGAYPLGSIITEEVADALSSGVTQLLAALKEGAEATADAARRHRRDSQFVVDRIARLGSAPVGKAARSGAEGDGTGFDSTRRSALKRKLRCLLYMKYLLALQRSGNELRFKVLTPKPAAPAGDAVTPADGAGATAEAAEAPAVEAGAGGAEGEQAVPAEALVPVIPALKWVPPELVTIMLDTFTTAEGAERRGPSSESGSSSSGVVYRRTPELRDKVIAYLVVLALVVDDFTTDLRLLAADLKFTPSELVHFFKEVGCTTTPVRGGADAAAAALAEEAGAVASAATTAGVVSYTCKLTVPLTFPS